jgi:DNA-binding transcriptional regulator of glucitol operon
VRGLITLRRLLMVGVSVLSMVACTWLAWWQWQRFESVNGTWQNMGYVLQWPLFGLFPAFLFWRLRRLRAKHGDQAAVPAAAPEPAAAAPPAARAVTRQDDEDPELAAYNRYLAQLNAKDQQEIR